MFYQASLTANFELTEYQITKIYWACVRHYDQAVNDMAEVGGTVFGFKNSALFMDKVRVACTTRDLQLITKSLEQEGLGLGLKLSKLLSDLLARQIQINDQLYKENGAHNV